jgi:hypothetical protein
MLKEEGVSPVFWAAFFNMKYDYRRMGPEKGQNRYRREQRLEL